MDQLTQVVAVLIEKNLFYIRFQPKSSGKNYVVLLFWTIHVDDQARKVQKNKPYLLLSSRYDAYSD